MDVSTLYAKQSSHYFKPLTCKVNTIDHLIRMQCSCGKHWVPAINVCITFTLNIHNCWKPNTFSVGMAHPNASYHPDSHLIKRSLDVPGQAVKDPTLNLQNLKESQHPVPDTTLHPHRLPQSWFCTMRQKTCQSSKLEIGFLWRYQHMISCEIAQDSYKRRFIDF